MDAEVLEHTSTVSALYPLVKYEIDINLEDDPQHSATYIRTICC
jgi:hypothetical protein